MGYQGVLQSNEKKGHRGEMKRGVYIKSCPKGYVHHVLINALGG